MSEEEFEIVDDLPVPEESKRAKYPFSTMDIGQCCVFNVKPGDTDALTKGLLSVVFPMMRTVLVCGELSSAAD